MKRGDGDNRSGFGSRFGGAVVDSFQTVLKQVRENWHILTALVLTAFFATVAAADARNSIADQGARLTKVEAVVTEQGKLLAGINSTVNIIHDDVRDMRGRR